MQKKYQLWRWAFAILAPLSLFSTPSQAVTILDVADPGITDVLFTGATAYNTGNLGYSMASGDFNGDGIEDLALGSPGMSSPQAVVGVGRVYLFYGGSGMSGLPSEVSTQGGHEDAMLFGGAANERAGDMMTTGDFDNDGADDLVIVSLGGSSLVPSIYVVYGKYPPALPITGDNRLSGSGNVTDTLIQRAVGPVGTWPKFHVSAITTGDLNNDTYDDLILSDKVNNEFRVLLGQDAKWSASVDLQTGTDFVLQHSLDTNLYSTDYFPLHYQSEIAGVAAGDLNGDGTDDLAMGLPNEDDGAIGAAGRVYVIYGGSAFGPVASSSKDIDSVSDIVISGGLVNDKAGGPLAMGKISGDNYADLVIGAPKSQQGVVGATGLGKVQVVYGGNALPATISLFNQADVTLRLSRWDDEQGVGRIGFATGQVILAKDANGDGIDDLVISSPGAFFSNGDNGWVHMVYGSASMDANYILDVAADAWFVTPEPVGPLLVSGRMGDSLALGDFDNDGRPDLAMGAPDVANATTAGSGSIPLLFKPASMVSCSGYDAQVTTEYPFSDGDFLCVGDNTLTTLGAVTIQSTATASFQSPRITLGAGFRVQTGAGFTAGI